MVMVDPRGAGMVLMTLRAAEEIRAPQFSEADGAIDAEMLAIARTIIERRIGKFDPSKFRDRYQEALRELIEARMKGLPIKPRQVSAPAPVVDLMAALKRSLGQEMPAAKVATLRNARRQCLIGGRGRCFCPYQVAEQGRKRQLSSRLRRLGNGWVLRPNWYA
jgi:non-homologous end joining protein Ku